MVYDSQRRGKGMVIVMAAVTFSKDALGRITIVFQYDPLRVQKVKTIEGHRYIQEILGHKSSKTTEIYTHVRNKDLMKIKNPFDQILKGKEDSL